MVPISIITSHLDELLQSVYAPQEPGLAVLLVKDGQPIYRQARGQANLEHQIPLTPDMPSRIGSITKPFTALAIMLLVTENKLNLTDSIASLNCCRLSAGL